MITALEGGEWSVARSGRTLPPERTRYPLYRWLGGPQGRSGQVRKILPPPGFDPRTAQPVVSHYTDWTTQRETGDLIYTHMHQCPHETFTDLNRHNIRMRSHNVRSILHMLKQSRKFIFIHYLFILWFIVSVYYRTDKADTPGKGSGVKVHLRAPSDAKCRRTPTSRPPMSGIRNSRWMEV
jgi:hypothetical protein